MNEAKKKKYVSRLNKLNIKVGRDNLGSKLMKNSLLDKSSYITKPKDELEGYSYSQKNYTNVYKKDSRARALIFKSRSAEKSVLFVLFCKNDA